MAFPTSYHQLLCSPINEHQTPISYQQLLLTEAMKTVAMNWEVVYSLFMTRQLHISVEALSKYQIIFIPECLLPPIISIEELLAYVFSVLASYWSNLPYTEIEMKYCDNHFCSTDFYIIFCYAQCILICRLYTFLKSMLLSQTACFYSIIQSL